MKTKRLIYPVEYDSYIAFLNNSELNKKEAVLVGIFLGVDVKTNEEVIINTFKRENDSNEIDNFFNENDVLYMDFDYLLDFRQEKIVSEREPLLSIKNKYKELKDIGLTDVEINDKMMELYSGKSEKVKRLYK